MQKEILIHCKFHKMHYDKPNNKDKMEGKGKSNKTKKK